MWISKKKYNKLVEDAEYKGLYLYDVAYLSEEVVKQAVQIAQLEQDNEFMSNLLIGDAE